MAAVSWPALVSVAGGARVNESTEVVHEVVDRDLPHPFQSLGGTESLWSGPQLTRSLECSEKAPPRFSFAFPSSGAGSSVPGPFGSPRSPVETREDFQVSGGL